MSSTSSSTAGEGSKPVSIPQQLIVLLQQATRTVAEAQSHEIDTVVEQLTKVKLAVAALEIEAQTHDASQHNPRTRFQAFSQSRHFRSYLQFLIREVLFEWRPCFSDQQKDNLFDFFFFSPTLPYIACRTGIEVVTAALKEPSAAADRREIAVLLHRLMMADNRKQVIKALWSDQDSETCSVTKQPRQNMTTTVDQRFQGFLRCLCSIPSRVANAVAGQDIPATLETSNFFKCRSSS